MRILYISTLLICYHISSIIAQSASVATYNDGLEKLGIFKHNNHFQASEQIFNFYYNNPKVKLPNDYIVTPGIGAHKLHTSKKTWNQARNQCITEGAHLAVMTSAQEEAVMKKLQDQANSDNLWLGLNELYEKDDWTTVLDQPLNRVGYANWLPGEPNNYQNLGEHCVSRARSGGMYDVPCNWQIPFVCKIAL